MHNDLWHYIGLSDRETMISGMIGWLLDPNGDHGLGVSFLNEVIKKIKVAHISYPTVHVEHKSKKKQRFDILLSDQEKPQVAFEVKCKTYGSKEQLERYSKIVPTIVRVGYAEWNFLDLDDSERKKYPLLTFSDIADILEKTAKNRGKYDDLINSIIGHLRKESEVLYDLIRYYISEEKTEIPKRNSLINKGDRFFNLLLWQWFQDRIKKYEPEIKKEWISKAETSGVWCYGAKKKISSNESLELETFGLNISGPFEAWIHFEIIDRHSLFSDEKHNIGKVQLRITNANSLNLIHEEFVSARKRITEHGYELPRRKPGKSSYYNAMTKRLSRKDIRYSSLVNILKKDFKEMVFR